MSEDNAPAQAQALLVRGRLEEPLSRWLWLVKWLLLIPHYIVLAFLWVAFVLVTVVAFFAILITGRYPAALFAFNLGVLRWSWRVSYYGYSGLATDRYPPFTLADVPDYPATLDIAYPARLSRGLVLVKWWLLAVPHYLLLGLMVGGTSYTVTSAATGDRTTWTVATGSLLSMLVLFAAVGLLFTARYPRGLYDFAMGLNRWVLRVVAYAALMTDAYPPFRLDQGGAEPVEPRGPAPAPPTGATAQRPAAATAPAVAPAPGSGGGPAPTGGGGAGAVVALVVGVLVAVTGVGLAAAGGGGFWLESRRDAAGFVSTGTQLLSTPTTAISVESVDLRVGEGPAGWVSSDRFGTLRVRATGQGGSPVFLGIAPQSALDSWLAPAAHDELTNIAGGTPDYQRHEGGATVTVPARQTFWSASVSGSGTQELLWPITSGRWGLVVARPDGAPGVQARVEVGARIPGLTGLATGLLIAGLVLFVAGVALVIVGAVGLSRGTGRPGSGQRVPMPPPSPRPPVPEERSRAEGSPTGR